MKTCDSICLKQQCGESLEKSLVLFLAKQGVGAFFEQFDSYSADQGHSCFGTDGSST
jgi:hypothetical protein